MADNHRPEAGHEERDVNVFAIGKFGVGLTVLIIVSLLILWGLLNYFKASVTAEYTPSHETRAAPNVTKLPPAPRLQPNPRIDLRALRAEEEKQLHSYGWVDREHGVVRIPIERAMEILAQRGLPVRPQAEGTK